MLLIPSKPFWQNCLPIAAVCEEEQLNSDYWFLWQLIELHYYL
jgi:hypothetical protein